MKIWSILAGFLLAVWMMAGCEWSGVTDDVASEGTNGTSGGSTDAGGGGTTDSGGTDIGGGQTAVWLQELYTLGSGDAGSTAFSGAFPEEAKPVVPGSVSIQAAGFYFTDDGSGGLVGGDPETSGSITYDTGAWSIDLGGADIAVGTVILGSWVYTTESTTNSESSSTNAVR